MPPGFQSPAAFQYPFSDPFALPNDAPAPNAPYIIASSATQGTGTSATATATVTTAAGAGDTIIVFGGSVGGGSNVSSCSDSRGNVYSLTQSQTSANSRSAQFTAVNPAPLRVGDTITVTWSGANSRTGVTAVGLPGAFLNYPAGNLIPDGNSTAVTNSATVLTLTTPGAAIAGEIALAWAGYQGSGVINWPPQWNVLTSAGNTAGQNEFSVAWLLLRTRAAVSRVTLLFPANPTAAGVFLSTFMPETRFAPLNPRPDTPPGFQSPGAWQFQQFPVGGKVTFTSPLAAHSHPAPAVARAAAKTIPAAPHPAGKAARAAAKALPAAGHPAGTLARLAGKTIPAAPHPSAKLARAAAKTIRAAPHPGAALGKVAAKTIAASPAARTAMARATARNLHAAARPAAALTRRASRTLAAVARSSPVLKAVRLARAIIFRTGAPRSG